MKPRWLTQVPALATHARWPAGARLQALGYGGADGRESLAVV
jgi:hypothetical protein